MAKGAVKDQWQRLPRSLQPRGLRDRRAWAIGMYWGGDPCSLEPVGSEPVLTKRDVTDVPADFVADPFMLRHDGLWYLFMEVLNRRRGLGEIGLATSEDARSWRYDRIVLREPFHLSYPLVFAAGGHVYMLPETVAAGAMRLYRAAPFPYVWEPIEDLVTGHPFRDPTLFTHRGTWWLFTETGARWQDGVLRLYHADTLRGPWREHPRSPVVDSDPRVARPAGRVIEHRGDLLRFAQDCSTQYGKRVFAVRITALSPTEYVEQPLLDRAVLEGTGSTWNADRMHHVDAHELAAGHWLACVDGH